MDESFDDEYFSQLTSWKSVTKIRGTIPYTDWVQVYPRDEALDCWKYALAALRLSGIDLCERAQAQTTTKTPAIVRKPKTNFVGAWK
jgi:phage terminase large subunit GpA-like protein